MKNKNCLLFYQELRKCFPSIGFEEGRFLRDIKLQLRDFSLINPNCSYEDIVEAFDSPQSLYHTYIESKELESSANWGTKKFFKRMGIAFIIFLVLMFVMTFIFHLMAYKNFIDNSIHSSETIIEEGVRYYD